MGLEAKSLTKNKGKTEKRKKGAEEGKVPSVTYSGIAKRESN